MSSEIKNSSTPERTTEIVGVVTKEDLRRIILKNSIQKGQFAKLDSLLANPNSTAEDIHEEVENRKTGADIDGKFKLTERREIQLEMLFERFEGYSEGGLPFKTSLLPETVELLIKSGIDWTESLYSNNNPPNEKLMKAHDILLKRCARRASQYNRQDYVGKCNGNATNVSRILALRAESAATLPQINKMLLDQQVILLDALDDFRAVFINGTKEKTSEDERSEASKLNNIAARNLDLASSFARLESNNTEERTRNISLAQDTLLEASTIIKKASTNHELDEKYQKVNGIVASNLAYTHILMAEVALQKGEGPNVLFEHLGNFITNFSIAVENLYYNPKLRDLVGSELCYRLANACRIFWYAIESPNGTRPLNFQEIRQGVITAAHTLLKYDRLATGANITRNRIRIYSMLLIEKANSFPQEEDDKIILGNEKAKLNDSYNIGKPKPPLLPGELGLLSKVQEDEKPTDPAIKPLTADTTQTTIVTPASIA